VIHSYNVTASSGATLLLQVIKVKNKDVPLPPCRRQREEYSSYSFLTPALNGGELSASRPGRALVPGKGPPVHTGQEAGWTSELV
jgi:hypothetical protein